MSARYRCEVDASTRWMMVAYRLYRDRLALRGQIGVHGSDRLLSSRPIACGVCTSYPRVRDVTDQVTSSTGLPQLSTAGGALAVPADQLLDSSR